MRRLAGAIITVAIAILFNCLPLRPPSSSDRAIAALAVSFESTIAHAPELAVGTRGVLKHDKNTFFWNFFTDRFGSNPGEWAPSA
jgi:hypothetical protein